MILLKKIKGVTLTEVLVVLAITAIVASLAFTLLNYFNQSLTVVSKNYSDNTDLQLLQQELTVDFNSYPEIKFNLKSGELVLKSPLDSIVYRLDEQFIIKEHDTLFKGTLLYDKYYLGVKSKEASIDAIKVSIAQGSLTKTLFISQPKSVAKLWD